MTRRITRHACVREGREGMLAYFNVDFETARPHGRRVWVLRGDPWELGALPLEYGDGQVDAFLEGYGLALRRAREHGTTPDPPPASPVGRPYQPEGADGVADAYDPMAVYRIAAEVGCWDCDDTVVCDCGKSWSVYYNPASDAEVIRRLRNHASCPYARRRRAGGHGTDPAPPPTGLVGRPSKPQAAVTSWRTFCTCPEPDLDDADRCRKCGTQWRQ